MVADLNSYFFVHHLEKEKEKEKENLMSNFNTDDVENKSLDRVKTEEYRIELPSGEEKKKLFHFPIS